MENKNEFYINKEDILKELKKSKDEGYTFLADITAVDYLDFFELVYQLFSFEQDIHKTLKVKLNHQKPEIESACGLWRTANWMEREAYDLMGIVFLNHPNLERILMWEGYEHHPLRKDFKPVSGRK